jgi:hypothetical protein
MSRQIIISATGALAAVLLMAACLPLQGKTRVTVTGPFTPDGIASAGQQFEQIIKNNGPAIANAFAMTNICGYPLGVATLGVFPSFFVGVSGGVGLSNLDYFDPEEKAAKGKVPVGGLNPLLYFGLGLSKSFDFIAKVFVYSDEFYLPDFSFETARLTSLNFYSFGAKVRYCPVKEKKLIPGLLKFGGLNVAIGVDFLYGIVGFEGTQPYPLKSIDIDEGGSTISIDLDFNPDYTARVEWYVLTFTPEIKAYFNVLWIFIVYFGFGFPVNIGSFDVKIKGDGEVSTDDPSYTGPDPLGTVSIRTNNEYAPMIFMPVLALGLELALWKIYFTFETNVNLINREDINMQLAFRIQI